MEPNVDPAKVLIVVSSEGMLKAFTCILGRVATVLPANTLEEGTRLFREHPDVGIVLVASFVEKCDGGAVPLIRTLREGGYQGKLFGMSGIRTYREYLRESGGCDAVYDRFDIVETMEAILAGQPVPEPNDSPS